MTRHFPTAAPATDVARPSVPGNGARRAAKDVAAIAGEVGLLGAWTAAGLLWDPVRRRSRSPSTERLRDAIAGRRILITGASSGIGRATAVRLGAAGGTLLLVARRRDELLALAGEIESAGGEPHVHAADLADSRGTERLLADVDEEHGGVDVLINNAGMSIRRSVARSSLHDYERMMQINYFGALRLSLGVLGGMRERGWGHIVNVSSMGTQVRGSRFSGYIASKSALEAVSDCAAVEAKADGVRWTTVHMPLVRTPMSTATSAFDLYPALSPEQAADMLADALVRRPRRVGTSVGTISGLAQLIAPGVLQRVLHREFGFSSPSATRRGGR